MAKAKSALSNREIYKSWSDVFNVVVQIIRGYYVLHERKLAHCDTKPADPNLTKRSNLQAVGCVALYISESLFGGDNKFSLNYLKTMTANAYTFSTLQSFLNIIMTYDIQFYGKTTYDELLELTADPDMRWKLGLLNVICYQKNYFKHVPKEQLKALMVTHADLISEKPKNLRLERGDAMFKAFIDAVNAAIEAAAPAPAPAAPAPAAPAPAAPAPAAPAPAAPVSAPAAAGAGASRANSIEAAVLAARAVLNSAKAKPANKGSHGGYRRKTRRIKAKKHQTRKYRKQK